MWRLTWRSLLTHKARLLLTSVAVILGTAFVAGTLIFTATLQNTFDLLLDAGIADVSVEPDGSVAAWNNGAALVSEKQLATVRGTDGVAVADADVLVDGVQIIGKDGKPVGLPQAPSFGWAWNPTASSGLSLADGRAPETANEVALDTETASRAGFVVGDQVQLVTPGLAKTATVVGLMRYGASGNLAGATMTAFDPTTARLLLLQGRSGYTSIGITAAPGTTPDQLRDRISAALGDSGLRVRTRAELVSEAQKQISDSLGFISAFLLVFAGIALLVGSFLVLNTFSVLVAQRARDLAMLRAIGATRRQVAWSVLGEALLVGLLGGTVGLGLGLLLALGIQKAFVLIGMDMPYAGLTVSWRVVLAAYGVAVVVTLLAAWLPARRASRIKPVAALRDATTSARKPLRTRSAVGAGVLALGVVALLVGALRTPSSLPLVGVGAAIVLVAGVMLSPWLVSQALAVGALGARGHAATARLALENGRRNPRRTATTASALMIGLMLVSAFGVFGASSEASSDAAIDRTLKADFVVSSTTGKLFSPDVADRVGRAPGMATVSATTSAAVMVDGQPDVITGVDTSTIASVVTLEFTTGALTDVMGSGLAVDARTASAHGWTVGDTLDVVLPGTTQPMRVAAVYAADLGTSGLIADRAELTRLGWPNQDSAVFGVLAPGADSAAASAALQSSLAAYPNVVPRDAAAQKEAMRSQVRQMLSLVYGLLALAVIIALLGIVNTLALSIVERTREIGLLRAVGATRRQVRRMITWESLVIAVYGAVLGAALGLLVGQAFARAMGDEGITEIAVPWSTLLVVVLLACLMGLVAAVLPARRAARLDVLASIADSG
ncbi:MAG TPA: FtsX-like permease family protein [Candidatus Nanopelagicales bacterium]|nr:FtsX-like permease family protein [Candidatus Nanopelagicales bacterium]